MNPAPANDVERDLLLANQPGLGVLRMVVERFETPSPQQRAWGRDVLAALTGALNNIPDGMASAALAGVNPVYGLYANIAGPVAGGALVSSRRMVVATTSAGALVAGQSLNLLPAQGRAEAMFLLVMLCGLFQIAFGLLRLGKLARFVSFSVMTGLLAGVAVLLVLSQVSTVTGIRAPRGNLVSQLGYSLVHFTDLRPAPLGLAVLTVAIALVCARSKLAPFGSLAAIAVPSLLVAAGGFDGIALVRDTGNFSRGFPAPFLPSLAGLSASLVTGALAVALITLVQGAGVSQSVPNTDGSRSSLSRDFMAQGAANVASGVLRGLPVGGSVGATALNVVAGARTRWAAILSGVWAALLVLVFPALVARVAMPALGGLLILAGLSSIKPANLAAVVKAGWSSISASLATFVATLFLPIQAAVGIGLVLSTLLVVYESSIDIALVEVVRRPDGQFEERTPPTALASNQVTVFDVYGPLFFSGAAALERLLPRSDGTRHPAVILRLRGQINHEATLIDVLTRFAERLRRADGRLYLTGIHQKSYARVAGAPRLLGTQVVNVYQATPLIGESTRRARHDAEGWLRMHAKTETASGRAASERDA